MWASRMPERLSLHPGHHPSYLDGAQPPLRASAEAELAQYFQPHFDCACVPAFGHFEREVLGSALHWVLVLPLLNWEAEEQV